MLAELGLSLGMQVEWSPPPAPEPDATPWSLRLRRSIPAAPRDSWSVPEDLSEVERAQLDSVRVSGIEDTPVEWWEVCEEGEVRYQLVLFLGDTGALFDEAHEVEPAAVVQGYWQGEPELGQHVKRSMERLRHRKEHLDTTLFRVRFEAKKKRRGPTDPALLAAAARMRKS